MSAFICVTCGTQFPESLQPPDHCPICEDPRQYVGWEGQRWTTLDALRHSHRAVFHTAEPGLMEIGMTPDFAIAQRALLIQTPEGNVLWDCIPLLDDAIVQVVSALGGIMAIAISHPHYYSAMIEWAHTFDAPVLLHELNRPYVMRPDPAVTYWAGDIHPLGERLTLHRLGGHFAGGTVLRWEEGAEGRGALLVGDILQVVSDRRFVSFMYSYPNFIPLPAGSVEQIAGILEPYAFDRIYGAWWNRVVMSGAKEAVRRSARRYVEALHGIGME